MLPKTQKKAFSRACPECGAGPGEPCRTTLPTFGTGGAVGISLALGLLHRARLEAAEDLP